MSVKSGKRTLILLLTAVAIATLTGCGDDGSVDAAGRTYKTEANTTMTVYKPSLTKVQFLHRINKICRKRWTIVLENWRQYASLKEGKKEWFDDAVREPLLAGIDFYIFDEIRQLGAPPGQEQEIEAIIGPFQIAVELGWKKRWQAHSLEEIFPHFAMYNERARRYGLVDCLVDAEHLRPLEGPA
jgi:hypothetical protein